MRSSLFRVLVGWRWIDIDVDVCFLKAEDGSELYSIYASMKFIDYVILATGGMGSLLTGLIYSVFTNWGWFKHKWIIVKWCINLSGVTLGTFWLGP